MDKIDLYLKKENLPDDWEVIKEGGDELGVHNQIKTYYVIQIPDDVLTIMIYENIKADKSSIEAGWEKVGKKMLHGHRALLVRHPSGSRSQYIWYCPTSNLTCMVNFTKSAEQIGPFLKKISCH